MTFYRFGLDRLDTGLIAILVETCMDNDFNTVLLMYKIALELFVLVTKKKKELPKELIEQ